MSLNFNGQVLQDKFVVSVLNEKQNGYFFEVGSNHPISGNNSYVLEKKLNWKGFMVEYDASHLLSYKIERPNSIHIIQDATTIDYKNQLDINNFPQNLDYLQIDLEVHNFSTLKVLETFNDTVFPFYKFACVTFEHDIYRGNYFNTRERSREIFKQHGYILVFCDVFDENGNKFEDWYIHPDLVNIDYINKIKRETPMFYKNIMKILDENKNFFN